jgi:hypothetical protein
VIKEQSYAKARPLAELKVMTSVGHEGDRQALAEGLGGFWSKEE